MLGCLASGPAGRESPNARMAGPHAVTRPRVVTMPYPARGGSTGRVALCRSPEADGDTARQGTERYSWIGRKRPSSFIKFFLKIERVHVSVNTAPGFFCPLSRRVPGPHLQPTESCQANPLNALKRSGSSRIVRAGGPTRSIRGHRDGYKVL